jgi:hypothetical protein
MLLLSFLNDDHNLDKERKSSWKSCCPLYGTKKTPENFPEP